MPSIRRLNNHFVRNTKNNNKHKKYDNVFVDLNYIKNMKLDIENEYDVLCYNNGNNSNNRNKSIIVKDQEIEYKNYMNNVLNELLWCYYCHCCNSFVGVKFLKNRYCSFICYFHKNKK